ncbi:MAG: rhodanese-like domain-containing protein [Bacteroidales bacterium]|nr:rhodanese-like domain-containing protein [Bacteroidales bacterium]
MKINHLLAILAILAGISAAFTYHAGKNGLYPDWKFHKERLEGKRLGFISAHHLADLLYSKEDGIKLLDTRAKKDYEHYHIPRALWFDPGKGREKGQGAGIIIVYGEDEENGPYELARELPGKVYVLKGGMDAWHSLVLFPDFQTFHVRNSDLLEHVLRRSGFFGGKAQNTQLLNIEVRESRYREGC